jgi:NAD(P)-dependent dehydrogenase (short-subunit alcohol dehydrogenase family)
VARAEITMDANKNNELVVVFGGSSGIGEAVARTMAARGSRVIIAGRDPGRLAAAAGRLGHAVHTAAVDAGDRDAVDAFFAGLPADAANRAAGRRAQRPILHRPSRKQPPARVPLEVGRLRGAAGEDRTER